MLEKAKCKRKRLNELIVKSVYISCTFSVRSFFWSHTKSAHMLAKKP